MKRRAHAPLMTTLLLCALAPMTLARCGGSANDGGGEVLLGTETGNPPVIKKEALHLEVAPGGMRLIGTPGAVTPGLEARVTNLRTSETAQTTAAADGSLDVFIAGGSSDEYEVTVGSAGNQSSVTLTAADLPSDLSTLSCNALENTLGNVVGSAFAAADTSCSQDSDCMLSQWGVGCYSDCGDTILSAAGQAGALADAEQRSAPVCNELENRPCERRGPSPCIPPSFGHILCRDGQCIGLETDELSCSEIERVAPERLAAVLELADRTCNTNDDCTLAAIPLTCVATCGFAGVSVSSSESASVEASVAQLEQNLCGPFQQGVCEPVPQLPCEPPAGEPTARCEERRCVTRYVQ
ncbi:MAG: hypothetical protein ABW217_06935 [Polyangiaceae bacterium]